MLAYVLTKNPIATGYADTVPPPDIPHPLDARVFACCVCARGERGTERGRTRRRETERDREETERRQRETERDRERQRDRLVHGPYTHTHIPTYTHTRIHTYSIGH